MKIKELKIINPRNWKKADYTGEFNETGMNTMIPQDLLEKLDLKPRDGVIFEYKGNKVSTNVGSEGRIGLTRPEIEKLGYLKLK
ncbi:MAG: hypothetical protein EU536_04905 [Promethearchaeota archaeon]|nr:MAG: hypothetical protein EU536_04905 [Candidatus Lokiarchaeota archaeon]